MIINKKIGKFIFITMLFIALSAIFVNIVQAVSVLDDFWAINFFWDTRESRGYGDLGYMQSDWDIIYDCNDKL